MTINHYPITLPLARYRFHFIAQSRLKLPEYSGSAWRGLLGHSLKRSVCIVRDTPCPDCLLWRSCVYSYIFETPPPADTAVMRHYPAAPHPFILNPDPRQSRQVSVGASLWLDCTLLGHSNQHLPYLIHALQQGGQRGIGEGAGQYRLDRVEQCSHLSDPNLGDNKDDWQLIYHANRLDQVLPPQIPALPPLPAGLIRLDLQTPLRIRYRDQLMNAERFSLQGFFSNLLRRLSMLSEFHGSTSLDAPFRQLVDLAGTLPTPHSDLRWHELSRYSSRQKTSLKMGGLLGQVTLDLSSAAELWPYLYYGQWVHTGKNCVMGLGRYQLTSL